MEKEVVRGNIPKKISISHNGRDVSHSQVAEAVKGFQEEGTSYAKY